MLPRVALDALVHVGQEGAEHVLDLVLFEHFLELDQRLLRIALGVWIDELELVRLAGDLESACLVDLVDGHPHALRSHPSVRIERAGLRLDFADLDDVLRTGGNRPCGETQCNEKPN